MTKTATNKPTKIQFIEYHKPALVSGDYKITVEQKIEGEKKQVNDSFSITREFSVSGERFELKPTDIHAVFPPNGSLGEHSNCLPHIILNRSTLPWERLPFKYPMFKVTEQSLNNLKLEQVSDNVLEKLKEIKDQECFGKEQFLEILENTIREDILHQHKLLILEYAIKNIPWLALLLFEEGEKPETKIITLRKLKQIPDEIKLEDQAKLKTFLNSDNSKLNKIWLLKKDLTETEILVKSETEPNIYFPNFEKETGQHWDDKVTVIDVQKQLLDKILPTKEDLAYLAHVRQGTDDAGNLVGDELAVIIGNRLPKKGSINTVHLVSIEERYNANGFNFQQAKDNDYVRLVSLKSWSFACVDEKQSFKGLLTDLNGEPSTLRLPKVDNTEAEKYLSMGYISLPHFLREGSKTFSWYHSPLMPGPLMPGKNPTDNITLPISAADELVRYNPNNGIFDISYAAAWELGRLLALQNKGFSVSLYRWKRSQIQQRKQERIKQNQQIRTFDHLPLKKQSPISEEIPDDIFSWLKDLRLLKGLPFNYLVPDERLLPVESIRFFWVDLFWIKCLLDGAFSIGRVIESDRKNDMDLLSKLITKFSEIKPQIKTEITGFLLRSDVVSGWPGLQVDGIETKSGEKLQLLRMERLSPNVLMCLFNGEIQEIQISQKPETIHFGFERRTDNSLFKSLRDSEGKKTICTINDIPWRNNDSTKSVINIGGIKGLVNAIETEIKKCPELKIKDDKITSAHFAVQAIEEIEMVSFKQ